MPGTRKCSSSTPQAVLHMPTDAGIWTHIETPKNKQTPLETRVHFDPVTPLRNSGKGGSRCGGRGVGRTRLTLGLLGCLGGCTPTSLEQLLTWERAGR